MWRDSKLSSSKPIPPPIEPYSPLPLAREPESGRQEGGHAAPISVLPPVEPGAKRGEGSHLGPSLTLRGDLLAAEDLYFDGKLEGSLSVPNHCAVIGPRAQVKADIDAKEIVVHGSVQGNLRAADRVQIRVSGSVQGDIATSRIQIEDGANFRGRIEIQRPEAASAASAEAAKSRPLAVKAGGEPRSPEPTQKAVKSASEL